jgi:calcineurin-like phosphoesterase family protein
MPSRVIAIGDIHGCSAALATIVDELQPTAEDTLVILGDCIDRGPDSCGVIDQLLALRERCHLVPILGNHEEMMLNYLDGRVQPDDWLQFGGDATLDSYDGHEGPSMIPAEHREFIESWGDFHQTDTHFFVHGGYNPEQPLTGQRWQLWRWQSLREMIPGPHVSGKQAVVGHTSQKDGEVLDVGHLICIDTYCYGGGWLTALEPTTKKIWQVDRRGRKRA